MKLKLAAAALLAMLALSACDPTAPVPTLPTTTAPNTTSTTTTTVPPINSQYAKVVCGLAPFQSSNLDTNFFESYTNRFGQIFLKLNSKPNGVESDGPNAISGIASTVNNSNLQEPIMIREKSSDEIYLTLIYNIENTTSATKFIIFGNPNSVQVQIGGSMTLEAENSYRGTAIVSGSNQSEDPFHFDQWDVFFGNNSDTPNVALLDGKSNLPSSWNSTANEISRVSEPSKPSSVGMFGNTYSGDPSRRANWGCNASVLSLIQS